MRVRRHVVLQHIPAIKIWPRYVCSVTCERRWSAYCTTVRRTVLPKQRPISSEGNRCISSDRSQTAVLLPPNAIGRGHIPIYVAHHISAPSDPALYRSRVVSTDTFAVSLQAGHFAVPVSAGDVISLRGAFGRTNYAMRKS